MTTAVDLDNLKQQLRMGSFDSLPPTANSMRFTKSTVLSVLTCKRFSSCSKQFRDDEIYLLVITTSMLSTGVVGRRSTFVATNQANGRLISVHLASAGW